MPKATPFQWEMWDAMTYIADLYNPEVETNYTFRDCALEIFRIALKYQPNELS